jgi:hypothetical protein
MKIGLVQSSGLGDIVIALPIAKYYHDRGHEIHWPIFQSFLPSFEATVPWVHWIGLDPQGNCLYETPLALLKERVEKTFCLYHYLAHRPDVPNPLLRSILKFDQYKYAIADVPFAEKWKLAPCLVRDRERERRLFDKLVKQKHFVVVHREGSGGEMRTFDLKAATDRGYQIIEISAETDCIFDWLTILENASGLILIDSVFANLVEQLGIGERVPKVFGVRAHKQVAWTPVVLGNWRHV